MFEMRWPFLLLSIAFCLCTAVSAQQPAPCTTGSPAISDFGVNILVGAPFSAAARITFQQQLPEANEILSHVEIHLARNSAGATHSEAPLRCFKDTDGTMKLAYSIRTYDPAQKMFKDWSVFGDMVGWRDKIVHTTPYAAITPGPEPSPENTAHQQRQAAANQWSASEYKTEQLDTRTMFGLSVQGTRTTRTIPAGKEGNVAEIVILDEHWWSQALGQDLISIHDDPRAGRTTYEIEDLIFGEPDPSWFIPPAGYPVEPSLVIHRQTLDTTPYN
jgi:hypothetical protein